MSVLSIGDSSMFRKHIDSINYPYAAKDKSLYYFKSNPLDICIIRVSEYKPGELSLAAYFETSEKPKHELGEKDEAVITKYLINNFDGECVLLYDWVNSCLIFDFTDEKELAPAYTSFDPETTRPILGVSYKWDISKAEFQKHVFIMETKPIVKAVAHFINTTSNLLKPAERAESFGCSVVFFVQNLIDAFPVVTETYIDLWEFDRSFRNKTVVDPANLIKIKRITAEAYKKAEEKIKKAEEEEKTKKVEEEKDVKYLGGGTLDKTKDDKPCRVKLSEIVENKFIPFFTIGKVVDIDVFQEELADVKEAVVLRSTITFYIDDPLLFKNVTDLNNRLDTIRGVLGITEKIGIALYSEGL